MRSLRPWQAEALIKARNWLLVERSDRHFLINAAPGAGKTLASCAIAKMLLDEGEIDRVIVIAPRTEVVNQWAGDFKLFTGRHILKVTGAQSSIDELDMDVCATWHAIQGLLDGFQAICKNNKVLVICDEHHHAAVEAVWGKGAESAFTEAKFVILLTGTPIRSDGLTTTWLAYDETGRIDHPDGGTYTLTYGQAVELEYCRPITFHRHEGNFSISIDNKDAIKVSSKSTPKLDESLGRIAPLQRALKFYALACLPIYEADGETPSRDSFQSSMLEYASHKLSDLRDRMPEAGGLIIAPNIEMAKYMAKILEIIEGEKPSIVHSHNQASENAIRAFKASATKRWLVSVAMVSEGVDIPRLRILVYLPNARTELSFRQAMGRVVRTFGPNDDTRAYVVMPSLDIFEAFARRVEDEMPPGLRKEERPAKTKKCPICSTECNLNASKCEACGHEFPAKTKRSKTCGECGAQNPWAAQICVSCGVSFVPNFDISLDQALRIGAIVRGMELEEEEVRASEEIADEMRDVILRSGDPKVIKLFRQLPEESWHHVIKIAKVFSDK